MKQKSITLSVDNLIKNTIRAMERVSAAALAGTPVGAGAITGKQITAQFSFDMRRPDAKDSVQQAVHRKLVREIFGKNAVRLERIIHKAVEAVVENMVGFNNPVTVMGRPLGNMTARTKIEDEAFAKFIKTEEGAGEIGLPDPDESLEKLKFALIASIHINVTVTERGPRVSLKFDQRKLLKLTPHPNQFEDGPKGAFYSWLSLVTGPDYVSGGTPGYALVRVSEINEQLQELHSGLTSMRSLEWKKMQSLMNMMSISRTRGYAGEAAAVMLKTNRSGKSKLSQAERFGGKSKDWTPSKNFDGFWDRWWLQRKQELHVFVRRIMGAAVKGILKG